jgi:ABC-type sugar transport system ATPase subunit
MTESRLEVRELRVRYGNHEVVHGISLDVRPGEMIALLGANGSGKSTTVKALTGVNPMSVGSRVTLNGLAVKTAGLTPGVARELGIRVVHQESPLIPNMTVAERTGLHLGFPQAAGVVNTRRLRQVTEHVLSTFDVDVDPRTYCGDLSSGERALVSLAISMAGIEPERALLILDEATASLSTTDSERLLDSVRHAADRGLAVITVTHRLPEVRSYCDRTVVLREGAVAAEFERQDFAEDVVIHAMVGDGGSGTTASPQSCSHSELYSAFEVNLTAAEISGPGVESVTLSVARGEILGVTGRFGEGASELLRLLSGIERATGGDFRVKDRALTIRQPRDAIAAGVFYLSSDRVEEGGVGAMSVRENLSLPKVERYGLSRRRANADVGRAMTQLAVRPDDPNVPFASLSGGNQQKVLLARWLLLNPTVLVLDDPTAGVDPHTREVMFATMRDLAADGVSIILRSTEPEHLARLCDRVLVMRQGRLAAELTGESLTMEEISRATYA